MKKPFRFVDNDDVPLSQLLGTDRKKAYTESESAHSEVEKSNPESVPADNKCAQSESVYENSGSGSEVGASEIDPPEEDSDSSSFSRDSKIPADVGRSLRCSNVEQVPNNNDLSSVCSGCFERGSKYGGVENFARVCEACEKEAILSPRFLEKLTNKRDVSYRYSCLICRSELGEWCHLFGAYGICDECIASNRCICNLCRNMKKSFKTFLTSFWEIKIPELNHYRHIDYDFSAMRRI